MELIVHRSREEVAEATAALVADAIATAPGRFSLGLAGGSTPEDTYLRLGKSDVNWSKVDAWLGDERWVATDSNRSNGHMAWTTVLHSTDAALHRPEWSESMEPEESARSYGRLLRSLHQEKGGPDLVLLGLGADGHTASLFPGSAALNETNHWYVANTIPETGEVRLTATYPLLSAASLLVFVVVGRAKAGALKDSLDGSTPAGRVHSHLGQVLWHVDEEAASLVI